MVCGMRGREDCRQQVSWMSYEGWQTGDVETRLLADFQLGQSLASRVAVPFPLPRSREQLQRLP